MRQAEPTQVFVDRPASAAPLSARPGKATTTNHGPSLESRLRRNWLRLTVFALLVSVLVVGIRWRMPIRYASTVLLMVEHQGSSDELPLDDRFPAPGVLYAYHLVTSSAVLDHLIDTFDLGTHYGTGIQDPMGRARTIESLLGAIEPQYFDSQCLSITVHDEDRELAAAMANAISDRLVELAALNREKELERSVALYTRILERAEARNQEQRLQLTRSVATELGALRGRTLNSADRLELERTLEALHSSFEAMDELHRSVDLSTELLDRPPTPSIVASRSALLDTSPSHEVLAIRAGLLTFPIALLSTLGLLIVLHFHGHEVISWLRTPSIDHRHRG